jgi:hypothetical protein
MIICNLVYYAYQLILKPAIIVLAKAETSRVFAWRLNIHYL